MPDVAILGKKKYSIQRFLGATTSLWVHVNLSLVNVVIGFSILFLGRKLKLSCGVVVELVMCLTSVFSLLLFDETLFILEMCPSVLCVDMNGKGNFS